MSLRITCYRNEKAFQLLAKILIRGLVPDDKLFKSSPFRDPGNNG